MSEAYHLVLGDMLLQICNAGAYPGILDGGRERERGRNFHTDNTIETFLSKFLLPATVTLLNNQQTPTQPGGGGGGNLDSSDPLPGSTPAMCMLTRDLKCDFDWDFIAISTPTFQKEQVLVSKIYFCYPQAIWYHLYDTNSARDTGTLYAMRNADRKSVV